MPFAIRPVMVRGKRLVLAVQDWIHPLMNPPPANAKPSGHVGDGLATASPSLLDGDTNCLKVDT